MSKKVSGLVPRAASVPLSRQQTDLVLGALYVMLLRTGGSARVTFKQFEEINDWYMTHEVDPEGFTFTMLKAEDRS